METERTEQIEFLRNIVDLLHSVSASFFSSDESRVLINSLQEDIVYTKEMLFLLVTAHDMLKEKINPNLAH